MDSGREKPALRSSVRISFTCCWFSSPSPGWPSRLLSWRPARRPPSQAGRPMRLARIGPAMRRRRSYPCWTPGESSAITGSVHEQGSGAGRANARRAAHPLAAGPFAAARTGAATPAAGATERVRL